MTLPMCCRHIGMPKVYSAADLVDARLVCDELIRHEVEAYTTGDYLMGGSGELPPGNLVQVWIRDESRLDEALKIIADFDQLRYSNTEAKNCDRCGETNGGSFEVCWNCGTDLGDPRESTTNDA